MRAIAVDGQEYRYVPEVEAVRDTTDRAQRRQAESSDADPRRFQNREEDDRNADRDEGVAASVQKRIGYVDPCDARGDEGERDPRCGSQPTSRRLAANPQLREERADEE